MHDFIAIGDIVTDAFIKLKNAEVSTKADGERMLSMTFGDKIPYESVEIVPAVGNSANAAVAAARLGLNSALIAHLGGDIQGKEAMAALEANSVDVKYMKIHDDKKTNYHYVLWYQDDRTILVKHEEYEYHLPKIDKPKWLYLSSLGDHTESYHEEIAEYIKNNPHINLAFQPGTFQMKLGVEKLKHVYENTNVFFCNVEEAGRILGIQTLGIKELIKRVHGLGPKIVVITDGPKGAYASDGTDIWFQSPYPDTNPPLERTGAGDAFASTTCAAIAMGKDLPTALAWGAVNSMSVVQGVGAQKGLLSKEKIEEYLKTAPEDFAAKKI